MSRPYINPWRISPFLNLLFFSSFLASLLLLYSNKMIMLELPLLSPTPSSLSLSLVIDPISLIFLSIVTLISTCVYNFRKGYIESEPHLNRFSALVLSFILSIYLLISIPNIITLLLGWDGLGLTSFLLIIYYQNPKSLGAGIFTFISNRIGDALIIISVTLTLNQGHWNILLLWNDPNTPYLALILMLGAITKRAQIPFSSWLPAAIAAPTPVSALVHSSTLVTAGVYLLIRFYPILSSNIFAMKFLAITSTLTTLMAGIAALLETDIKKIIALSTLSQLGIIIMRISLGSPSIAFFHLITHATFKALLFISAGTLIHTFINTQDLRTLGNVSENIPLTSAAINTANIALCGLPFLRGFYSKDQIIELTITETSNSWIFIITIISTTLTAAYSFRFSYYTLWSPSSSNPLLIKTDNQNWIYTTPIIIISTAAITTGTIMNWMYVLPIYNNPIPLFIKLLALIVTIIGIILTFPKTLTLLSTPSTKILNFPNTFITIWFLTFLSTQGATRPLMKLNTQIITTLDHGWNELLGPQGIFSLLKTQSQHTTIGTSVSISTIILTMLTGIIILSLLI